MLPEWLLQVIVDHIFNYIEQSGIVEKIGIAEKIRTKLGLEPAKEAFKRALGKAIEQFQKQYPQWAAALFDASFFQNEGAPILAQFLVRDGHPDPSELAARWADSLNIHRPEQRITYTRELELVAANFLDHLAHELKTEPELQEINDSRAFEQLVEDLNAIRTRLNTNKATYGTLRDYLNWLIERNLYLDPRGTLQTQRQVQVKLDEVYISLQVQRDEIPNSVDRWVLEKELAELEARFVGTHLLSEELEDQREQLLVHLKRHMGTNGSSPQEMVELAEAVNRHERLVILGDPGSGKSTLLHYLALKHAQALWNGQAEAGASLGATCFPILVRISDYAEHGIPQGKSLSDFLADYCSLHECPKLGLADLLTIQLARGKCLVLLDGLDEIVNPDERRKVVEQIENFVRHHDNQPNRFVITSRTAGYRSAPLGEPFAHYIIQDLDDTQILRFLEHWCSAVEAAQTPELSANTREITVKREVDGIIRAVQNAPGVRRLAANPLLLRILALIHRTGSQLPQKRIELYRLAADTLARTWRTAQGVREVDILKDEYLTPLLSRLAYWLHVNKPTGIATEREVYEVLGAAWAHLNDLKWDGDDPNPKIKEEVTKFLLAVREHTGLFVERAPHRYGFMHLTFEEYYVARYLVARSKTRARLIRQHLHDPRWDEPILLALGFVGLESSLEAGELLTTAILADSEDAENLGFTPSSCEDHLGRDYIFALRCLGDNIPVRPRVMKPLMDRLANELLYQTGSARFQDYREALEERLAYLKKSEAVSALLPLLAVNVSSADSNVRYQSLRSLRQLELASDTVMIAILNALCDDDPKVRSEAALSFGYLKPAPIGEITPLLKALHDEHPEVRYGAALSLGQLSQASHEVVIALLNLIQQGDTGIRYQALQSLRQLSQTSNEILTVLLNVLNEGDLLMSQGVALALPLERLERVRNDVVTILLTALHNHDPWICLNAVEKLGKVGKASHEIVTALLTFLQGDTLQTHYYHSVAGSLAQLGQTSPEVVTVLLGALHDADPTIRYAASLSLGQLGQTYNKIVPALLDLLHEGELSVRYGIVRSLGQLGKNFPEVVSILLKLLHDDHREIRYGATLSLGQTGQASDKVVTALLELLHENDSEIRYGAIRGLSQLGQSSTEMIIASLEQLHNKHWTVRKNSAEILGKIGRDEEQTIQALWQGLIDEDRSVRGACARALVQLGRRFPDTVEMIANKLVQAIKDPEFDKPDNAVRQSGHEYAFHGLWLLVVGGEIKSFYAELELFPD